jgi:hypothetical protein
VAAGVIFSVLRGSTASSFEQQFCEAPLYVNCVDTPPAHAALDRAYVWQDLALGSFIAGGVAIVAGGIWLIAGRRTERAPTGSASRNHWHIAPFARGVGLTVGGTL